MLTESTLGDRILGVSKVATVPTNCLVMANGNNLSIKGDMQRRIIAARIEAGENPERRTFKRADLLQWVKDNRPRLVAAGLTVLRAYDAAGRPRVQMTPYGSYEDWSARVRAPLMWLGEADPVRTNERFKVGDPERESLTRVLHGAWAQYVKRGFLAKDAAALLDGPLADALSDAGCHDAMSIGLYLKKNLGRTIDGLQLVTTYDAKAKVNRFYVINTKEGR